MGTPSGYLSETDLSDGVWLLCGNPYFNLSHWHLNLGPEPTVGFVNAVWQDHLKTAHGCKVCDSKGHLGVETGWSCCQVCHGTGVND